jgi:hypothetical protein
MRHASTIVPGTFCGAEIEPGVFHTDGHQTPLPIPDPPAEPASPTLPDGLFG